MVTAKVQNPQFFDGSSQRPSYNLNIEICLFSWVPANKSFVIKLIFKPMILSQRFYTQKNIDLREMY